MRTQDLQSHLEQTLGGSYRVIDELSGGGMARVFTAEDRSLGRRIVIKVLPPDLAASVNQGRFHREIQVAAGLQHPNIVPVLSAGDVDGLPYYTMPYVAGRGVRETLARDGRIPMRDVLTILRDVARALAYAHDRGVVHRDIKPDNILWAGGAAAVTDFGIAKAISAARTHAVRADYREPLTTAGMSLGTPAYMAPEQISADPDADHRIDIYSFGITAYELICGSTPFAGRTPQQVLTAHLTERPQHIGTRTSGVPRSLADLVMRCLEKDPAKRPQTANEILDVLAGVNTGETATQAAGLGRRTVGIALAVAILLVVAGVAFFRGSRPPGASARPDLIAVLPFRVAAADASLRYLREGMLDLLASKITGEGGLRVLEPRVVLDAWHDAGGSDSRDLSLIRSLEMAESIGAGRLLLGDVVGTPGNLVLSATIVGVPRGDSIARVTVEGHTDSLAVLVDRLALEVLARTSREGTARLATLGGTSLPALRAYLDGQARLRRAEVVAAADAFERALQYDSSFALAGLGLNMAASWFGAPDRADRGLRIARRERHRLSQRDQALVDAIGGPRFPESSTTREIYQARQSYLQQADDRADAWYLLGDHILHFGRVVGMQEPVREALRHFTRAAELDSTYVVGYIHAIELAAAVGDIDLAKRFMRMRASVDTSSTNDWYYGWILARAANDTARLAAIWLDSTTTDFQRYHDVARTTQLTGYLAADGLRSARYIADLSTTGPQASTAAYHWALNAGQSELAERYVNDAFGDTATQTRLNRGILRIRAANVGVGDPALARAAAAALTAFEGGELPADSVARTLQRGVTRVLEPWRLLNGDSSQTDRSLARLVAFAQTASPQQRQEIAVETALIRALRESLRPRQAAAPELMRLDSILADANWAQLHSGRAAEASILLGRLFAQRGDAARAAAAVRRRSEWNDYAQPYLAAQLRDEGRYLAEAGEAEAAIAVFEHYLRLRYAPDGPYAVEVAAIRTQLARLRGRQAGK